MEYFSVGLMNKIESAKNLLSRSRASAAGEKSRIMQSGEGQRREGNSLVGESSQPLLLNCMVSRHEA